MVPWQTPLVDPDGTYRVEVRSVVMSFMLAGDF
jgi:hypothetical protein